MTCGIFRITISRVGPLKPHTMERAKVLRSQLVSPVITHEVTNQAPFLENYNTFLSNQALIASVKTFNRGRDDTSRLTEYGGICGKAENLDAAKEINDCVPVFTPFDKQGRRVDQVRFVPSYHHIMNLGVTHNIPSLSFNGGCTVARCALSYLHYQLESGTSCPLTVTYAAVPPLKANSPNGEFDHWVAKLTSGHYDGRDVAASQKKGVSVSMSMTEKQGGSDVRANTTHAVRIEPADVPTEWDVAPKAQAFRLYGHKWFTSAPMCDAFLTLAQTTEGLSCFLVPRWLSASEKNTGFRLQRLKSKLGDRSNASSEVEYLGAVGFLVGKLGRGVPTIIDMVNHTRLDCLVGSAALMQAALAQAVHHTTYREAFGSKLADKPLMANVLTDLALEVEGATALAMRVAASFDDPKQEAFKRIATAIGKYYVSKRAPAHVYECLECLGGNGYVEDFPLARYYRQAPLNAIWEGSGNVMVVDVFRAIQSNPATLDALQQEVASAAHSAITATFESVMQAMNQAIKDGTAETLGRVFVEKLALVLEACAVVRLAGTPQILKDAFVGSRLGDGSATRHTQFGTLAPMFVSSEIVGRHRPVLPQ
jgi:putative acyl-CoA dehydrogenase